MATNKVWISLAETFTDAAGTVFSKGSEVQGIREAEGVRIPAGVASMKENFIPWNVIEETYLKPKKGA